MTPRGHGLGVLLIAASAVAYSTAGFYVRLIPLDPWTILFWRGLFAGGFMAACVLAREGRSALRAVRAVGWPGLVVMACSGVSSLLFINALHYAPVAQVMIILATLPFVIAGLGRIVFGTRETRTTLIASALALLGVALMVGGAGDPRRGSHLGELLACGATLLLAVTMLTVQRRRDTLMLPAAAAATLLASLLAAPLASPLALSSRDLGLLALFGMTQSGLGWLLLTLGTRLVSATESALIGNLEVPLAAFWVWLAFAETPQPTTLAGGLLVIAAVLWHIWRQPRLRPDGA
ncbi:MAG: DMT family transporter [Rhodospirillales bacterium]|nr:DMT family transporter [Rhodospirillales bacterium]